ncbi:unnamed protein product [Closterium sp. NIES-53]
MRLSSVIAPLPLRPSRVPPYPSPMYLAPPPSPLSHSHTTSPLSGPTPSTPALASWSTVHLPPCSQRLLLCLLTPLLAPTIGCVVPLMLATCLPFPYPFYALLFSPPGIPPPSILPSPPLSSLAVSSPPFSDFLHAARRTVSRVLSSLVTDSTSPPRSVLAEFTSVRRLDYATQLVSAPARPPSASYDPSHLC